MPSAVILAGGLGTRLRSEVPDLPKPMAPVAGRPFLEFQIEYWLAQGIDHFVLSVGYRHEAIVGHFGNKYGNASLDYVIEREPLGTGGGLLLALRKLDAEVPFLLLNGDTYFAVELRALRAFAEASQADWCLSLFRAEETGRYMGMEVGPDGRITSLKSASTESGCLANGGVYWVRPRALQDTSIPFKAGDRASVENDILPRALESGQRMYGREFSGTFIDIGIPEDYRRAPTVLCSPLPRGEGRG